MKKVNYLLAILVFLISSSSFAAYLQYPTARGKDVTENILYINSEVKRNGTNIIRIRSARHACYLLNVKDASGLIRLLSQDDTIILKCSNSIGRNISDKRLSILAGVAYKVDRSKVSVDTEYAIDVHPKEKEQSWASKFFSELSRVFM